MQNFINHFIKKISVMFVLLVLTLNGYIQVLKKNSVSVIFDLLNMNRFGLVGDGKLLGNLDPPDSSREVEVYNGRAVIRVKNNGERAW